MLIYYIKLIIFSKHKLTFDSVILNFKFVYKIDIPTIINSIFKVI